MARSEQLTSFSDGQLYTEAFPITAVPSGQRFDATTIYLGFRPHGGMTLPDDPGGWGTSGPTGNIVGPSGSGGLMPGIDFEEVEGSGFTYTGGYAPYLSGSTYTPYNGASDGSDDLNYDLPADFAEAIAWALYTKVSTLPGVALPQGIQSLNIAGEYTVTRVTGDIIGADGYTVPIEMAAAQDLGGRCLSALYGYGRFL
jgi:hypothetical protein